ncbi:MAG: FAD-dependent oxidoreductase [Acidobacteria bacterium]|nr:FAD-dependent oxidoreductase [Acidobacteriota bacterium]
MVKPHVVILGAGPGGLGAAFQLVRRKQAQVTVLERSNAVGGNAGSFELAGMRVDYGSHRLHPACDAEVLRDIREMLNGDLLDMPRHGRIRLRGHWIHFPLKPLDLALKLPPSFAFGVVTDFIGKVLPLNSNGAGSETFSSILEKGLGRTICRDFYFPYARKLWGVEPEELSATQARRRVSADSLTKMVRKVLSAVPGFKPPGSGRFFYPRQGYGQISEAYYQAARQMGATFHLNANVVAVEVKGNGQSVVSYQQNGQTYSATADYIWSTIPITVLANLITPPPPSDYLLSAKAIDYRGMILIYLVLGEDQFTEYDAHYFPEKHIRISRLSEPKNYSASNEPRNRTVLCAELPCSPDDLEWKMSDEQLGILMSDALSSAGLPVKAQILQVASRRLRQAYPIYLQGYERHFNQLDNWLSGIDGLLTFGRQGLFAHDNTHHALYMAYAAVNCLNDEGHFDHEQWQRYRQIFETHVVED